LDGGVLEWDRAGLALSATEQISVEELAHRLHEAGAPQVVDVRRPAEWGAGHITGALHIPLQHLAEGIRGHARELRAHTGSAVGSTAKGQGFTEYVVDMISQEWRSAAEVDRPRWQHWLTVIVPDQPRSTTALLLINGGRKGRAAPRAAEPLLALAATRTATVV